VHIHGDQPQARYELLDPDFPDPVAVCTGSCTVYVMPGRYRLHVSATAGTREGTSTMRIEHASRVSISPRTYSSRWVGLGTAIAGMGALVGGMALFAVPDSPSGSLSDSRFTAGLVTFLAGAALTPIGWVVFGKSFHPSVRVLPARTDDNEATARLGIGPGGLSFSARF
jgi:hypothetical protein